GRAASTDNDWYEHRCAAGPAEVDSDSPQPGNRRAPNGLARSWNVGADVRSKEFLDAVAVVAHGFELAATDRHARTWPRQAGKIRSGQRPFHDDHRPAASPSRHPRPLVFVPFFEVSE